MGEQVQLGIELLKIGDAERARQIFAGALLQDRRNVEAWLWLASAVETDAERLECLRQALKIDPLNEAAVRGITRLEKQQKNDMTTRWGRQIFVPVTGGEVEKNQVTFTHPPMMRQRPNRAPAPKLAETPARGQSAREPARVRMQPPRFYPPGMEPERLLYVSQPSLAPSFLYALIFLTVLAGLAILLRENRLVVFLLLLPGGLVGIGLVTLLFLQRAYQRYVLTTGRLVIERGLVNRTQRILPVINIDRVECQRTLIGALMHSAEIIVYDRRGGEYILHDISASAEMLNQFRVALDTCSRLSHRQF